ncbi:hypothetical protein [Synechococcus elongatus]|uniref:hypothetical protein n=1 Tax=Synechococcus elongatus TaxID=32046 RepID=UPI000F7DC87E|nr:hypothetical protein [Synechococcus elongatus]
MYDGDGHFDPMDDYFTEDDFYIDDPEAEERDRWPTEDQAPPEVPTFAPIPLPEKPKMAQPVSLASGVVKFTPNEPRDYGYGPRISALISSDTGEEVRVYGNEGDPILLSLKKGQRVQLVKVKTSWTIAEPFAQSLPVEAQTATAPSIPRQEAQTAYALKTPMELATLWADAFKELRTQLPDAPPEILGPAATSILINITGSKRL